MKIFRSWCFYFSALCLSLLKCCLWRPGFAETCCEDYGASPDPKVKVKVKVWTLVIAPLTWVTHVTSNVLQSRKWQLIGMSQWCRSTLCGHPLPALTDSWTHGAASRHTNAPISHTKPLPRSRSYYSFPVELRVGGWVGLNTQWVSNLLKVACSGPGVSRTRNLSVTSPILYHYTTDRKLD